VGRLAVLVVVAVATMGAGIAAARRSARPELVGAASFGLLEVNLAVSVALSGGARSPLLALMAVPVSTQAVCFRPRVTLAGVGLSAVLMAAAVLTASAAAPVAAVPGLLYAVAYLALLACLSLAAYHLAAADLTARGEAVLDPLTGLFNRKALQARFGDIRAQARTLDVPVAVAMCDVDRFKAVNDTHGHDRGDLVLQELAYRLRAVLRTYDLIYRMGGEEFLILLPGRDLPAAAAMADRLRVEVAAAPLAGLAVTVSIGVSSARGDGIDLTELTHAADQALYTAKHAGRNQVATAPTR